MIVVSVWAARVTQAEFEVPLVDTTDFVPSSFRTVWAYHRATRWPASAGGPNDGSGSIYENYEGFAVGEPTASENGTTSLYRFDGQSWEKIIPQGSLTIGANYQLNAVAGQFDNGTGYAPIWLVGRQNGNSRKAYMLNSPNLPKDYNLFKSGAIDYGKLLLNNYNLPASAVVSHFLDTNGAKMTTIPDNSELYAMGNAQAYGGLGFAGGMRGWLATRSEYSSCAYDILVNQVSSCPDGNHDRWYLFQLNDPAAKAPTVNDSVTGITYVDLDVAYVTTSTFPLDATSQPQTPYATVSGKRDCSGTQTGKIFRVIGSPRDVNNWTLLKTISGECFYGLTATTIDAPSASNGPLQTDIWIASSKGVRRLTDDNAAIPTSIVKDTTIDANPLITNKPVYSVTSALERSGNGQQLLLNGDFQAWAKPLNTAANIADATIKPSGWIFFHNSFSGKTKSSTDGAGACESQQRDVIKVNEGGSDWAIRIEPGLEYNTTCTASVNGSRDRVVSAVQRINFSDIEGTRFRVSGTYQVTYLDSAEWPAGSKPVVRQGGVLTTCAGTYPPNNVDCPYANFKEIRTLTSSGDSMASPRTFAFEFSRAFSQMQNPIIGIAAVPPVSNEGMFLEIRCQGTYGVRVDCDDLKIEVVSDPPQDPRSVVSVLAVGYQGLTLINTDAVGGPTTWALDDATLAGLTAGNQITLNSVVNGGGAHIFAAGSGTALFQRTPGNISGFMWLGATQVGSSGNAALGWIATNCANFKNSAQRSLCQRQSQSFGLSLENNALVGRAWLGKQITSGGVNSDSESRDLGTCQLPARRSGLPAGEPYNMSGSCDTNAASATYRRCLANTSKACLRDFDCYGRCSGDEAFICLSDTDCVGTNLSVSPATTNSRLNGAPAKNLVCATTGSSPNACTGAGWLTFNANDLPVAQRTLAGVGSLGATFSETTGQLSGLGRFMTLANTADPNYQADQGWVKLRGPASVAVGSAIYGAQNCTVSTTEKRCSNNLATTCTTSAQCGTGVCVPVASCKFGYDRSLQSCQPGGNSCVNYCGGNTSQPCSSDDQCSALYGNTADSCEPKGYCSNTLGGALDVCTTDGDCGTPGSFCVKGAVCATTSGNSCNLYGVDHDQTTGKFQGFAWSTEYGWVDFRALQKGTSRFLQTRLGDIYSGGDIGASTAASSTTCNATYLISAVGQITNFCTALPTDVLPNVRSAQSSVPVIPISSANNDYRNALGRFDLTGLETVTSTVGGVAYNKYDLEVVAVSPVAGSLTYTGSPFNDPNSTNAASFSLGRKVYVADCGGTCTITQALKIVNAGAGQSGAGLLVVRGNLRITNNLQYISSTITDLRQLASLAIVVRGNLEIENQVTNVIGAYYVEGTVFTTPASTATSSDNRYPLTVRGLMIAKAFEFNRKFAGTVESPLPSELFIFDGRLQSNPLPGMTDFAGALPDTFNSSP